MPGIRDTASHGPTKLVALQFILGARAGTRALRKRWPRSIALSCFVFLLLFHPLDESALNRSKAGNPSGNGPPHNIPPSPGTTNAGLPNGVLRRLGSNRLRPVPPVDFIRFSPDAQMIVTGGLHSPLTMWSAKTGEVLHRLDGAISTVCDAMFVKNGRILGITLSKETVQFAVWDGALKRQLHYSDPGPMPGRCLGAVSPAGLGAICAEHEILLGTPNSQHLRRISHALFHAVAICLSKNGRRIALLDDRSIHIIETQSGQEVVSIQTDAGQLEHPALSPDGRLFAGCSAKIACLWDCSTGRVVRRIEAQEYIRTTAFSDDGGLLAIATGNPMVLDGAAELWDLRSGALRRRLPLDSSACALAIAPNGKLLASANADGEIILVDCVSGERLPGSADPMTQVRSLRFARGGKVLFASCERLRAWNAMTGRPLWSAPGEATLPGEAAVSPDGTIYAGFHPGAVDVWEVRSGRRLCKLDTREEDVGPVEFTPDSKRIVTVCNGRFLRVWDLAHPTSPSTLGGDARVSALVISTDGNRLVAVEQEEQLRQAQVWDIQKFRPLTKLRLPMQMCQVAVSPDGNLLAGCSASNRLTILDLNSDAQRSFQCPCDCAQCIAFSADGRMIATGGSDSVVRIWEIATGKQRQAFYGHRDPIQSVSFSYDGSILASASATAPIYLWDLDGGKGRQPGQSH